MNLETLKAITEFGDKLNTEKVNESDIEKLNGISNPTAYYYKASFYYKKEDYIKAKQEIEFAIELLRSPSNILECFLYYCDKKDIFRLAGKIYANLGEVEKSKYC